MRKMIVVGTALALAMPAVFAQPAKLDPAVIEQATGIKPTYNAKENVYKVTRPRPNLATVDGWTIPRSSARVRTPRSRPRARRAW
jgi:hypothetical protein